MVSKELFVEVLRYIQNGEFAADNLEVFETKDYQKIGDIIIAEVLNRFGSIEYDILKQIICKYIHYSKEEIQETTHNQLCLIVCEKIMGFKSFPADEYVFSKKNYERTKRKYLELRSRIDRDISAIDNLIRADKKNPQNSGELIKQQEKLCSRNATNKSILKDLKKIEDDYIVLYDEIQETYVYKEMLKYAKSNIESYFNDTVLQQTDEILDHNLRVFGLKLAREEGSMKALENIFLDYDRFLDSWDNVTQSIYKPFFMIKMRKFNDDIETFYYENHRSSTYFNKTDELLALCKEKSELILDSDGWIVLKSSDPMKYLDELKRYVAEYNVLEYLKENVKQLYSIQKRKEVLQAVIESFEHKEYIFFINLVVIQIEGIFYDLFLDANIQKRLNGQFDMFEKDDLKSKFSKNENMANLEEATMYFKFYFNNIIRNKIAHGRISFQQEELETASYELLFDLQYVIYLISNKSDTSDAIKYVQKTLRWLEHTFKTEEKGKRVFERLLNSLNGNVIESGKEFVGYNDPYQELYWIFNPYYEPAYKYAEVIEERNKLLEYLTSQEFWIYVSDYLTDYDKDANNHITIKNSFKSRVKAIQMYIANNKRDALPIIAEVNRKLEGLALDL
ncbi:hypothetical protein [Oceanobacillus massiliensis]|uniref:hypothetical protein n=1 Tax=Oceanobacillus massiliensis TaxID=1465765 RepID=UPI00028A2985|nr:hypothetical protein [Oceanobacillus massiliensis]